MPKATVAQMMEMSSLMKAQYFSNSFLPLISFNGVSPSLS